MLNGIFVFVVLASILLAAYSGQMEALTGAILQDSRKAVELSLGLIGVMAFFLGLMKVAEDGGILRALARGLAPIMRRLFPAVPPDHPAMSAMILNIASNMLGLGNAATPFGIKAIGHLDELNGTKGTATNAMVLFLAINTSGLAILPSGVIALRAAAGSQDATGIFFTTWFASGCATIVAISAALLLSRMPRFAATEPPLLSPTPARAPAPGEDPAGLAGPATPGSEPPEARLTPPRLGSVLAALLVVAFLVLGVRAILQGASGQSTFDIVRNLMSYWTLPLIVGSLVLFGWVRGVRVYESVVEGAKEGFNVAIRIIPFLVAILVGVGMFRASGGIDLITRRVGWLTDLIGMPAEALPMAILRPLTGSGAMGVMTEVMSVHGPDSLIGYMVSTFQGSTETTFYILAVYFGAVGIKKTRHALPACLLADVTGILGAVFIVNLLFG